MIKKSDKKYAKVCGCDEYGREAWLMVSQHKDSIKIQTTLKFYRQKKVALWYILNHR